MAMPAPGLSQRLRTTGLAMLCCVLVALAWPARAAGDTATREIDALIDALDDSGCQFWRNGSWHDGAEAREHLQRKYDWARRRQLAGSAEDFIERAASRSSLSGKPYRVRCPGQPEVDSAQWFRNVLRRIRVDAA
jgi:hypothetical protein